VYVPWDIGPGRGLVNSGGEAGVNARDCAINLEARENFSGSVM
jgi:hypothetical protein